MGLDKIRVYLYNSTHLINSSMMSGNSPYFVNFTGLSDGLYYFNATVNDTVGNINYTETRTIILDNGAPGISFIGPTLESGNYSLDSIWLNVNATDFGGIEIIRVYLYNSTHLINSSMMSSNSPYFVNFTGLSDGLYYFNATVNDTVGNINFTETRTIRLDKTAPLLYLIYPQDYSNFTGYNISRFSFNVTDSNGVNCSLYGDWNNSWHLNQTITAQKNIEENFTEITTSFDGYYLWGVICTDNFGNINISQNRTFSTFLPVNYFDDASLVITQSNNFGTGTTTLYWNNVFHSDLYEVYKTSNLFVAFSSIANTSINNFTDNEANLSQRAFYKVKVKNPVSESSSNIILGKTIYFLERVNANATKNFINFYLNNTNITNANKTLEDFGNLTTINLWNSTIQKRVTCNYFSCPEQVLCTDTNCNFELENGNSYEVNLNSSSPTKINWSYVGILQNSSTITLTKNLTSSGKNWVGMYGNSTINDAIALIQNISNADAVSKWNASSQTSVGVIPNPFPWIPTNYLGNFSIVLEEGLEVSVNESVNWVRI
jgi:hypothetical protein